jgi:hypothetical protein
VLANLQQVCRSEHTGIRNELGLVKILLWDNGCTICFRSLEDGRKNAADGPYVSAQGEFSVELAVLKFTQRNLSRCKKNRQCDREIESPPIFRQFRWGEVDDETARRELEVGVEERGAHPILTLAECGFGQADDAHAR